MQSTLNNATNISSTGRSPNEILYDMRLLEILDLLATSAKTEHVGGQRDMIRKDAADAAASAATQSKFHFDRRHDELYLQSGN